MAARITIISGFLGSGKTTLLKRSLDWEFDRGNRPQVIMSEFGDFDIDSQIIADERLQVAAVTGGCICCSNRDQLKDAVGKIVTAAPESPLYIETTGVADPAGVLETLSVFIVSGDVRLSPVLVVYDVSQHGAAGKDAILIEKQLMTADVIVLNKTDLVMEGLERVVAEVKAVNPLAKLLPAVHCNIDLAEVTSGTSGMFAGGVAGEAAFAHYHSFAFKLDTRLLRIPFEKWLESLPADVVRVKGFVRFEGENGIFQVQKSRRQSEVTLFPTDRWMDATLVIIAHPVPADAIVGGLAACVPAGGNKPRQLQPHE